MIATKNIIPVWQPLGFSTHRIAKELSLKLGVKTTHTGTLDPMAQGVILILCGEERYKKQEITSFKKGYEFEIAFGVSTDSYDSLGFITGEDFSLVPKKALLKKTLSSLVGAYTQVVPLYSAIKVEGKHLFEWGHLKRKDVPLPKKSGEIYRLELLDFYQDDFKTLLQDLVEKLKNLKGDFRQEEVIFSWKDYLKKLPPQKIYLARIYAEISRGLYVRSLSQDICSSLGILGFVCSLTRVKNGPYTRTDCQEL